MKAVVYNGPRDVAVKTVPAARIVEPTDVLVKITTTNICGSDLHLYEGRTRFEPGRIFATKIWEGYRDWQRGGAGEGGGSGLFAV
ncbi:hypothetical protein BK025_10645 [Sodalis sp. TME1]|nr:hypothetical protein BK025_10645 [Sodalis sp. TME1]